MNKNRITLYLISLFLIIVLSSAQSLCDESDKSEQAGCKGKVVDSNSRPVSGARVVLYYNHSRWGLGNRIVEETKSSDDGSFVFEKPLSYSISAGYPYHQDSFVILATHPDYALGWHNINRTQRKAMYKLILTEPVSQTVTVIDLAGNPLADAKVWPYNIGSQKDTVPEFQDNLSLPTNEGVIVGITGEDGRAVINNLPRTRWSFYATLERYARGLSFSWKKPIRLIRGATVAGTVLTEDNKAVEGAIIRFRADWMWQFFLAKTDSQGRFRLEDLPANGWDMSAWGRGGVGNGSYSITMEHNDYTTWQISVQLEPGEKLEDLRIDACPGTLIKCRILETETNQPVGGTRISGHNESGRIDGYSDPDGMFAIRVLPSKTTLRFYLPPKGVYIDGSIGQQSKDIPESRLEFDAEGDEMAVTLKTPRIAGRLISVKGIVLGTDGKPPSKAVLHAAAGTFQAARRGYIPPVGVDKNGCFELKDVPAGRRLCIYVVTNDHKLAGTAELVVSAEPGSTPFVQVKLRATKVASVIIKDKTGLPLCNTRLSIRPMVKGQRMPRSERIIRTDIDGSLQIPGNLPGLEYDLQEVRDSIAPRRRSGPVERKPFRGTLVLISDESDAAQSSTVKHNGQSKQHSSTVRTYIQAEGEKLMIPLIHKPLPDFNDIEIKFTLEQARDKKILVCFFDYQQRPSRNCLRELNAKAQAGPERSRRELKAKDVIIIAVHASKVEQVKLDEWIKENNISFPVGIIKDDEEQTRFNWSIHSLPWLILTDRGHIVRAEGFAITELGDKVKANN